MSDFKIFDDDVAVLKVGYHDLQNILDIVNLFVKQNEVAIDFASKHPKVFRDKDKIDELNIYKCLAENAANKLVDMLVFADKYEKVVYKLYNEFTNTNEERRL